MQPTVQIDSDSLPAIGAPEFADRFGRLLTATRRRSRRSVRELAATSRGGFDASQLRRFERGTSTIDETIVEALGWLYSADLGQILPARHSVTITGLRVFGPGASVEFAPGDPRAVLVAYLRLVRRLRTHRTTTAVALRRDDVLVLAGYLGIDGAEVVERLSTLIDASPAQRVAMAMLFATGALVIGLATGGHVAADSPATTNVTPAATAASEDVVAAMQPDLTVASDVVVTVDTAATPSGPAAGAPTRAPATAPVTAPASPVVTQEVAAPATEPRVEPIAEVATASSAPSPTPSVDQEPLEPAATASAAGATATVIDQAGEVTGAATATRLEVPEAAPAAEVASAGPTPNQSGCNPDPSEAVMSVVIPDISYTCPVYAGGQAMIDAGFVTLVTDAPVTPLLAMRPGDPGTLWLAGHRSTHGAAFADVPDLADGALVTVTSDGATATYRIAGRSYVEVRDGQVVDAAGAATVAATWSSIIRDDQGGNLAARLVLQTCEGADFRWMVYADLVG